MVPEIPLSAPANVIYRQATLADGPELARLRWTFSSPQDQAKQGLDSFRAEFLVFLEEAFASGRWAIFVAEQDGRLVGNAFVQVIRKVPRPARPNGRYGYVTNVYVEEALRGYGIGERLMQDLLSWSRAQGLQMMLLWPANGRENFYQRLGFTEDTREMEQVL